MRFPKKTRSLIHRAAPNAVTIPWPPGAPAPEEGKVYWMQSEEEVVRLEEVRERHPETCAEVLAGMRARYYGTKPRRKGKRRRIAGRPKAGDPRLIVQKATILDIGWEVEAALYTDPDPVRHLRVKARVPAGPNPISGHHEPTETEPEQIVEKPDWRRRLEEEEAMKLAHKASVDMSEAMKAEQKLLDQRRKGRRSKLAEQALERVRKRTAVASAPDGG